MLEVRFVHGLDVLEVGQGGVKEFGKVHFGRLFAEQMAPIPVRQRPFSRECRLRVCG